MRRSRTRERSSIPDSPPAKAGRAASSSCSASLRLPVRERAMPSMPLSIPVWRVSLPDGPPPRAISERSIAAALPGLPVAINTVAQSMSPAPKLPTLLESTARPVRIASNTASASSQRCCATSERAHSRRERASGIASGSTRALP